MNRRLRTLGPPVVLILLVVAIAGAVHTYASPPGGLQLPVLETENADARIRTGKQDYPQRGNRRRPSYGPHGASGAPRYRLAILVA